LRMPHSEMLDQRSICEVPPLAPGPHERRDTEVGEHRRKNCARNKAKVMWTNPLVLAPGSARPHDREHAENKAGYLKPQRMCHPRRVRNCRASSINARAYISVASQHLPAYSAKRSGAVRTHIPILATAKKPKNARLRTYLSPSHTCSTRGHQTLKGIWAHGKADEGTR
jgi:hypothetical protein